MAVVFIVSMVRYLLYQIMLVHTGFQHGILLIDNLKTHSKYLWKGL